MDDIELLGLAAKAAGYQVEWVRNSGCYYRCEEEIGREQWDPLDDDGDALRLLVALNLEVSAFRGHVTAFHNKGWCDELRGDDADAAARRAIVRAAAEAGKQMGVTSA